MTSLAGIIMAHPARGVWADELSERTEFPIHWDTYGEPTSDPARRWRVGAESWEKVHSQGAEWSMVLQDDALVCSDMVAGLETALTPFQGRGVVSPYLGQGRPNQRLVMEAIRKSMGSSWACLDWLNWGVAIVVPTWTIPDMLDWCSQSKRVRDNYDYRIACYYRNIVGWRTHYTRPSLVDHRDDGSLAGHYHTAPRVAHNFLGENNSALEVEWKTPNLRVDIPPRPEEYKPSRVIRRNRK